MRGRHTLGPTESDSPRDPPVSVRASPCPCPCPSLLPTVLARGRSTRVRYCGPVRRFGMLVWCATGSVRGRARSGRLRCEGECGAPGVVGVGSTQVGFTTNGSWGWGRGAFRRRRMHMTAITRRRRRAAPPRAPPSSAPKSRLVEVDRAARVLRREERKDEGASAGRTVRGMDSGDVVDAGGSAVLR
jgi:hypothetical protein